jgi:uncharacterized protein YyaL (SSP411 family)
VSAAIGALKEAWAKTALKRNAARAAQERATARLHPETMMSRNLLDQETSPYLLLHKDNPVHWRPWGREALEEAASSGKPILLSIGYTACHWCHMMNQESFTDPETAARMNEMFVNIKVDREERPDIDMLYQAAANGLGNAGGWPLTAFLTPTGETFFAGTYFPNEARFGQVPFKTILDDVTRVWREQPQQVADTASKLSQHLTNLWGRDMRGPIETNILDSAAIRIGQRFDIFFGGISGQLKFPSAGHVEALWRAHLRSGAPQFAQLVSITLDNILLGGLYDHIGGGFARYATDERWYVPHFEKIASDSAQLIDIMTLLWQHNRNILCQNRIEDTVGWLLRDMRIEDGFAASLDSDSEGEEGKYYLWTEAEIDAALMGTFAQRFKVAYNITRDGNFNGRNILRRLGSTTPFPQSEADEALFAKQRALLLAARQDRVAPMRDDKVLADANGQIIAALANAGAAMRRTDWTSAAVRAFDFAVKVLGDGNKLYHSWRAGVRGHAGFCDDYAHMARAALMLWEVTGDKRFLDHAKGWVLTLNEEFWDMIGSGYFYTGVSDDPLMIRTRSVFDQSQPCGNGVMIGVLARLHKATGEVAYLERANALAQAFAGEAARAFISMASYFNNLEYMAWALQIVVVGPLNNPKTHELAAAVWGRSLPNRLLMVVDPKDSLPPSHPAQGKTMENGQPTAYVCQRNSCSAPIVNPVTLSQMLQLPQNNTGGGRPQ